MSAFTEYRVIFEAIQFDTDGTHGGEKWWKPVAHDRKVFSVKRQADEKATSLRKYPETYRSVHVQERTVTIAPWETINE